MELDALVLGLAKQRNPAIQNENTTTQCRVSLMQQQFTAGWVEELVLAGHVYNVTVGGISAGGDVALIQGGGAGTTIDSDQPELAVGVPDGYFLIPIAFQGSFDVDLDADAEVGRVLLFADTTQNIPAPVIASATLETPVNHLGGGPAFPGYAESAVTADITDPVLSALLYYDDIFQSQTTAASISNQRLNVDWKADAPMLLKGPASIIGCWGGTAAVSGLCKLTFACVPKGRYAAE